LTRTIGTIISDSRGRYKAPTRDAVTMIPSTRRSAKVWTIFLSLSGSAFDSARNTQYPRSWASCSIPLKTSLVNGSAAVVTTSPIVIERRVTSPRATALA
jgi:hypothetical protein